MSRTAPTGRIALALARGSVSQEPLRAALEESFGYEAAGEASEFVAAFDTATDAVRWSLAVQASGAALAVHLGVPESREDKDGRIRYGGLTRDRLSRVAAAAHPGQLLVTERAWQEADRGRDSLGSPVAEDLGELWLAGLEATEHLFDVHPVGASFPRPSVLDASRTNLPPPTGSFVGREPEMAALTAALATPGVATLHGPGGMGKTRLALRFAAMTLPEYTAAGGLWLAELGESRTADGLTAAVSRALGVPLGKCATVQDAVEALGAALAARGKLLLVLDQADLVARPLGEMLTRWRALAPTARFLVTAADPLRIPGERARLLESLSPGDALKLFGERVRAADPEVEGEPARASWAEISRRLEGVPLALELVAARAGEMAPQRLLEWSRTRFALGAERDPAAAAGAAATAVWEQLEEWEQFALAQCAIFRGGFSLEAAEDVLDISRFEDAPGAVDVVQKLWDRGLLRAWEPAGFPGELRFGMPSPVLALAAEKLEGLRYGRETASHHALHFLDLAEECGERAEAGDEAALARLSLELENVAYVVQSSLGEDPPTAESSGDALRALKALDPLLAGRGPGHVRRAWIAEALAVAEKLPGLHAELVAQLRQAVR